DARLLLVFARLDLDPGRLARLGIDRHHLRGVDRHVLGDLAALLVARVRAHVARHRADPLHDDLVVVDEDLGDLALLALVLAADDLDEVAHLETVHQSTSGASEMIFMNFFARSSRATGPKMRVPIGSLSLLMRTALLPSKRM